MKTVVPVINALIDRQGKEKTLENLKKCKVDLLLLALDCYKLNEPEKAKQLSLLKKNAEYFKNNGFTVGAWIWTFTTDGRSDKFTYMQGADGNGDALGVNYACPLDKEFNEFACNYISDIAKTGVDLILFDDDFRFGVMGLEFGCCCDLHIADISKRLGENVTREKLKSELLKGGKNKYRSAWLKAKGESLENFAKNVRRAVDKVNPEIRVGQCACITTWDADGTNSIKISKILAGNTKPFMRLSGAPYWTVLGNWGNRFVYDVIEMERAQTSWCANSGIEIISEGDTYPRPRYFCPANYLEIFDTALLADGKLDGALKYMFDYVGSADYERGYIERHIKNENFRNQLQEIFKDKQDSGVRVYENYGRGEDVGRKDETVSSGYIENLVFPLAGRFLSQYSIPTNYTQKDICAVFGENIKSADKSILKNSIIDIFSAEYLFDNNVDTGIVDFGEGIHPTTLFSEKYNEYSNVGSGVVVSKNITVKNTANVLLWFDINNKKVPAVYTYSNGTENFLVINFDARNTERLAMRSYLCQKALIDGIKIVSGKSLPVICEGNPDLYIMAKKSDNKMAVGVWNCFADDILEPKFTIDAKIKSVKFINTNGSFSGNTVITDKIGAFSFCAFELEF